MKFILCFIILSALILIIAFLYNLFAKKGRKGIGTSIVFSIAFLILILYSLTIIFVFLWTINNSFKTQAEYLNNSFSLPKSLIEKKNIFMNFSLAFKDLNANGNSFFDMLFNSIWFSLFSALIPLFFTTLTAYCFAKYDFVGKKLIFGIIVLILIIPLLGSFPATYKLYYKLNLVNSPLILVAYTSGFGGYFLILMASFETVSWSYAESAQIDGANSYTICFRIMIPQVLPSMFTLFLLSFIASWNDYMTPYLYLKKMPTLSTGLFLFEKERTYHPNWPVYYSGIVLLSAPIIVIFTLFCGKIMNNVSIGGLKG